jgi:SAM-dependent methyltransferase
VPVESCSSRPSATHNATVAVTMATMAPGLPTTAPAVAVTTLVPVATDLATASRGWSRIIPAFFTMNPRYYIKHMENLGLVRPLGRGDIEYALDLGCGRGGDSDYLSSLGYTVVSVDEERHNGTAIISDIRSYAIEAGRYSVIICNNVLPFILDKKDVEHLIRNMVAGLKKGGVTFFTVYGPHSGFKGRKGMSFYEYEEILKIVETLPVEIMDRTTTEGYSKNGRGEIIYQHSHRFMLKRR